MVKFKYNSWGFVTKNILVDATHSGYYIANNNPFMYKGYYYDVEKNMKWLEKIMIKTLHHLLISILADTMILVNK